MKTYWWNGCPNFGDQLAPHILKHFSGIDSEWAPLPEARAVVTGSVLQHIETNWSGMVLGAGKIWEDQPLHLDHANVKAIRGPLSAKGVRGCYAIGDPGLLADEIVGSQEKRYDVGVLPHWSDADLHYRPEFFSDKWTTRVINPREAPLRVVESIGQCRKLVTSSLHGVIVADGFGIPRRVETCDLFTLDTMFKFHDYSASINHKLHLGVTSKPHRGYVEARKHELWDVFEGLRGWKS